MTAALGLLLAHQGGWDEALFVLAPLLLFAALLLIARKRVGDMEAEDDDGAEATGPSGGGTRPNRDPDEHDRTSGERPNGEPGEERAGDR